MTEGFEKLKVSAFFLLVGNLHLLKLTEKPKISSIFEAIE